ncbi:SdpI family protein [Vagococcus sp.]|uniref:SdpI family protein n=1 Tax=Vagococcus sp. TaxID=1933889 RepID=UPI000ECDEC65|nr:SdpI family protein [Vagococcus sp.]HCT95705.1 hypothetical protein [Vagococcus sp.]
MKKLIKKHKASLLFFVIPFMIILIQFSNLPAKIPVHFDWKFEPDRYVSKTTFLMFPFFLFLLQLFLLYIEDKKGEPQNQTIMTWFYWLLPVLTLFVTLGSIQVALHNTFTFIKLLPSLLPLLFIIIGNTLPQVPQNYTLGIKIPTTLSSADNWYRTHRVAGRTWVIGGLLMIFSSLFFPTLLALYFIILASIIFVPIIYSLYIAR